MKQTMSELFSRHTIIMVTNFKHMKKLFLIPIFALALYNCSTERIEPKKDLCEYENAEDFLEVNKTEEQVVEITEESDAPLIGKQGTKISISKDILMFPNGDSVHLPYTVKLIELYSAKDMIYAQMPSMSDNTLLSTHGEIRLRAFKDDTELVLRPEKAWRLEIPNANPLQNMLCYYGDNEDKGANWSNSHDTKFSTTANGYTADVVEMGWVSCAKTAINNDNTLAYKFRSDSIDVSSLSKFIYIPNQHALMQVKGSESDQLPIESYIKIVCIGQQAETLYRHYTTDTVSIDNTIELELKLSSESELTKLLNTF